ncbi:MAG TPA: hypothetical protein VEX38_02125, partial [Fimbriimonadaceae bacterium]|nr:hypothetical protein [Fimbriimonadaceae bacterium]
AARNAVRFKVAYNRRVDPKRKLLVSILTFAGVLAVAIFCALAFLLPRPDSFLEDLAPRRLTSVQYESARKTLPPGSIDRMEMLVFPHEQSSMVLKRLQENLTPEEGYVAKNNLARVGKFATSIPEKSWTFRNAEGTSYHYLSGICAAAALRVFEKSEQPLGAKCVVTIRRKDSWLEKRWAWLRRWTRI